MNKPIDVECPYCHAKPGQHCKAPKTGQRINQIHSDRISAAQELDVADEAMYKTIIMALLQRLGTPLIMSMDDFKNAYDKSWSYHMSDDNLIFETKED